MAKIRITLSDVRDDFQKILPTMIQPVRRAATSAMRQAANNAQREGQGDIGANLSKRMARFFQVEAYPKGGKASVDAAAQADWYSEKAELFDEGGTVHGVRSKYLWLPLSNAFGKKHVKPSDLGVRLSFMARPNKVPLLGTQLKVGATTRKSRFGLTAIRHKQARDISGNKFSLKQSKRGKILEKLITVPLFFGILAARIRKHTHIRSIVQRQQDRLEDYFNAAMNPDDRD